MGSWWSWWALHVELGGGVSLGRCLDAFQSFKAELTQTGTFDTHLLCDCQIYRRQSREFLLGEVGRRSVVVVVDHGGADSLMICWRRHPIYSRFSSHVFPVPNSSHTATSCTCCRSTGGQHFRPSVCHSTDTHPDMIYSNPKDPQLPASSLSVALVLLNGQSFRH